MPNNKATLKSWGPSYWFWSRWKTAFWCLLWGKDGDHGGPHLQKVRGQSKKITAIWPSLISIADHTGNDNFGIKQYIAELWCHPQTPHMTPHDVVSLLLNTHFRFGQTPRIVSVFHWITYAGLLRNIRKQHSQVYIVCVYVLLRSVAVCVDRLVPVSTSANQICSNFIGCCLSVCVRQKTTLCCVVCCYCSHSRELSNSSLATVCAAAVLLYYAINTYAGFFAKASGGDSLRHPYWCHPPLPPPVIYSFVVWTK